MAAVAALVDSSEVEYNSEKGPLTGGGERTKKVVSPVGVPDENEILRIVVKVAKYRKTAQSYEDTQSPEIRREKQSPCYEYAAYGP